MCKWVGLVTMTVFCLITLNSFLIAQEGQAKPKEIQIIDAKLGKDVKDRVLVDEDSTFALNSKVFLWLKVTGAASETLTITWSKGEKSDTTSIRGELRVYHSMTLNIGGSPWRTWANKTLAKAGDWTVTISDAAGNKLKELSFKVQ